MLHPFERTLRERCRALLAPGDRVVVAFSAGPDSTALLAGLAAVASELELELLAAHLDHGLRSPAEARADREAAAAVADRLEVPLETGAAQGWAEVAGSVEAAARAVRYRFLAEVALGSGAQAVATGHTRDDQVETVLLRLVRGTGLEGLGAMRERRPLGPEAPGVALVRPMLALSRAEVLEYLADRGLPSRHDPTNDDERYLRNRLRTEALPTLRAVAGRDVDRSLLRLAGQARAASATIDRLAEELLAAAAAGERVWRRAPLAAAEPAVRAQALRRLSGLRAEARHVAALEALLAADGGALQLPGGARARVEGEWVVLEPGAPCEPAPRASPAVPLELDREVLDPDSGLTFSARRVPRQAAGDPRTDPGRRALLDAARALGALEVRRRRPGDLFWPLGAPGRRSLKRFFIDRRIPRSQRDRVPVVALDGRPVWIVGHRIDDRYKVTPSTAEVLELRASEAASGAERSGT